MTIITIDRKTVDGLTQPDLYWDETLKGFGLRVRTSAKGKLLRSYIVQYRHEGGQRRRKLGDAHKLSPEKARMKAMQALSKVEEGIDPAEEKDKSRAAMALTFQRAVEQYLDLKKHELRPTSLRLITLYLTGKKYFGALHSMPLTKITRSHVSQAIDRIVAGGAVVTAGRARAHLSAFFTWCLQRGHCDLNPVIGSASPEGPKSRDRVLSDAELAAVWKACRDDEYGKIVRLLMLTGCRRQEIGGLLWSEIDLEAGTMTLPSARTKNGREHTLWLPAIAVEIIESVPQRVDRDHLFGERADKGFTAFQHHSLDHGITKPFRLHDIRRSVATGMADIGIQPHIIEAVLNHVSGHKSGVAGIYNRSSYQREVKNALAVWADHIDAITTGSERKVVNFPTG